MKDLDFGLGFLVLQKKRRIFGSAFLKNLILHERVSQGKTNGQALDKNFPLEQKVIGTIPIWKVNSKKI